MKTQWQKALEKIRRRERTRRPVCDEEIAAAEEALGKSLPASYKELCRKIGPVDWPVSIDGPAALVERAKSGSAPAQCPDELLFFASDDAGMHYAFDTRGIFDDEYFIVPVDLDEGWDDEGPADSAGGGFREWLLDLVAEASMSRRGLLTDELDALERRRTHEAKELLEQFDTLLQPEVRPKMWAPDEREIDAAERRLGVRLPKDYRSFSAAFGSVDWPLRIVDATELAEQRSSLDSEGVVLPERFLPFGRRGSQVFGFAATRSSSSTTTQWRASWASRFCHG